MKRMWGVFFMSVIAAKQFISHVISKSIKRFVNE